MLCERAQELFSEYCEGTLPAALTVPFESHLQVCAACRADLEGLRALWPSLGELSSVDPPADFRARVWQRIAEAQAAPSPKRAPRTALRWDVRSLLTPRGMRWVGAAAALALMALLIIPVAVTPARMVFPWSALLSSAEGWSVKPESARLESQGGRYTLVVPVRSVSRSEVPVVVVPDVTDRRDVRGEERVALSPARPTEVRLEVGEGALGRRILLRVSREGNPGDFRVVPVDVPRVAQPQ